MTTIAVILFIILCPYVSYILVRRELIPWNGGVMLLMGDDSLAPIDFSKHRFSLDSEWQIKGVFLPGALRYNLPEVGIRTKKRVYYSYIEADGGVYVMFDEPLSSKNVNTYLILDVASAFPWKGQQKKDGGSWNSYYTHISFDFK